MRNHTLLTVIRTLTTLAWLAGMFLFVSMPDDAPLWRGSPAGLALMTLWLVIGLILYEAWRTPEPFVSSQADQAPRIRQTHRYRTRGQRVVVRAGRDW